MSIVVRKAEEKDLLLIQRLIARAGLREDGVELHLDQFLVVTDERDQLIGTVGLEAYEKVGLLRSLVLDSAIWTARLSLEFLQISLSYAKEKQIETVYLCSKGTNVLFHQLGFRHIDEKDVPKAVKQSPHFKRNKKSQTKVWACSLL